MPTKCKIIWAYFDTDYIRSLVYIARYFGMLGVDLTDVTQTMVQLTDNLRPKRKHSKIRNLKYKNKNTEYL